MIFYKLEMGFIAIVLLVCTIIKGSNVLILAEDLPGSTDSNLTNYRLVSIESSISEEGIRPESQLRLELEHLLNAGSILYVAAHPDDENNLLFTKLARGEGYRVGYFCFTRGEGGQNLIGDEHGKELGVLRSQELLAARQLDGAEQFFGGMFDFGFSKSSKETLEHWGYNNALGALVRVVREFQPQIIITRFPSTGEGGHGHHTASAILAEEAFYAAGDPNRFPEQLAVLKTWRTSRLLYNQLPDRFLNGGIEKNGRGDTKSQPPGAMNQSSMVEEKIRSGKGETQIDIRGFHPAIGDSYSKIAARARSLHRSQGMGTATEISPVVEYFILIGGKEFENASSVRPRKDSTQPDAHGLFSGLDISWGNVEAGPSFIDAVQLARSRWNSSAPQLNLANVLAVLDKLRSLPASSSRDFKERKVIKLIREISSLQFNVSPEVIEGEGRRVEDLLESRGQSTNFVQASQNRSVEGANIISGQPIKLHIQAESKVDFRVESIIPSWLEEIQVGVDVRNKVPWKHSIILPTTNLKQGDRPTIQWKVSLDRTVLIWREPLVAITVHPVYGEQQIPLRVLPDFTVTPLMGSAYVSKTDDGWREIYLLVRRWNRSRQFLNLKVLVDHQWEIDTNQQRLEFPRGVSAKRAVFKVRLRRSKGQHEVSVGVLRIREALEKGGEIEIFDLREMSYPHISPDIMVASSEVRLIPIDLRRGVNINHRIGIVEGVSDQLPEYLRSLGYTVELLDCDSLKRGDFSVFDAIVLGIRSMAVRNDLRDAWSNIEDYVKGGGVLLMLYQQTSGMSGVRVNVGDAQFIIGKARVTEEDAPIMVINPVSRILRRPNIITDTDFSGWIQERGLSFAKEWSQECHPVIELSDSGESPQQGAILDCRVGRGNLIYTGLSFSRQIPNGNAGAIRLLENLLAR